MGRRLTFVNITGVESNAAAGQYTKSKVVFRLQAPEKPGEYPLVGAYFYGTEKATTLGRTVHPLTGTEEPLGGFEGFDRLVVGDRDVFDSAGFFPIRVLRSDSGIIETRRRGVDGAGLAFVVLQDIAVGTVQDARAWETFFS